MDVNRTDSVLCVCRNQCQTGFSGLVELPPIWSIIVSDIFPTRILFSCLGKFLSSFDLFWFVSYFFMSRNLKSFWSIDFENDPWSAWSEEDLTFIWGWNFIFISLFLLFLWCFLSRRGTDADLRRFGQRGKLRACGCEMWAAHWSQWCHSAAACETAVLSAPVNTTAEEWKVVNSFLEFSSASDQRIRNLKPGWSQTTRRICQIPWSTNWQNFMKKGSFDTNKWVTVSVKLEDFKIHFYFIYVA